jgi:hypothetical protein
MMVAHPVHIKKTNAIIRKFTDSGHGCRLRVAAALVARNRRRCAAQVTQDGFWQRAAARRAQRQGESERTRTRERRFIG